jgi:hypothetical protein
MKQQLRWRGGEAGLRNQVSKLVYFYLERSFGEDFNGINDFKKITFHGTSNSIIGGGANIHIFVFCIINFY